MKLNIVLNESFNESEKLIKILQEYIKKIIAPYKYPRSVIFVKSLPKTKTGKIQRFLLRNNNIKD